MEQKLYYLKLISGFNYDRELEYPEDLQDLLESGWYIAQLSTHVYGPKLHGSTIVLLLQREKNESTDTQPLNQVRQ